MSFKGYEFYYEMLSIEEKPLYRIMYDGFSNRADTITIPPLATEKVSEIYEKVIYDHPEIFYVVSIKIETMKILPCCRIIPQYRFSKEEINYVTNEVEKEISPLLQSCLGKSDVEKEQCIHDYIVQKATYKDLSAPYSHEMPGVFLYGIGVCEGIAKAFKFLCDRTGIKAGVVIGNTREESVLHAWNLVSIEQNWYNIDVTYDANLTRYAGDMRYDYFNISDNELVDRESVFNIWACNSHYGFYEKNYRYAPCQNELKKILEERTEDVISVQLPKLNCSQEQLQNHILETAIDSIRGLGRIKVTIYPNYDMGVYTINMIKSRS